MSLSATRRILIALAGLFFTLLSTRSQAQWIQTSENSRDIISMISYDTTIFEGNYGGGVERSTNNGMDWTVQNTGITDLGISAFLFSGGSLYAATFGGAFVSSNNGNDWTTISTAQQISSMAALGSYLFIGISYQYSPSEFGVYRSSDMGANWAQMNTGLPADPKIRSLETVNSTLFAGTSQGAYASTDMGTNWNAVLPLEDTIIAFAMQDTNLYAATAYHGVFRSSDTGKHWTATSTGLSSKLLTSLAVKDKNIFVGFYDDGVYLSTNYGNSWNPINMGLTDLALVGLTANSSYLFAGADQTGVWRRPLSDFGISSVSLHASTNESIISYPNPFTQSTTISFTAPESGASIGNDAAEVSIVNLLGAEVARLFEGELGTGEHTFTWNAANMPPGAYWVMVRMNGTTQHIPIVLQP
jgi:hypothetical protein